ncbi:MAG: hypothetical protein IJX53_00805 [Clostridia bacterium]|nr:hypothetical protein [Clostridia bacterium]
MDYIISTLIGAAILIITAAVTVYVIPWLKEKHLLGTVKTLVEAAEKLAENQPLDKKAWVVAQLENLGVKVTPFVEAAIESAVKQLDIAMGVVELDALMADLAVEKE